MSEISFARAFLSALDARPLKLHSDHIADQRQLPTGIGYTLPKYPSAPTKRKRSQNDTGDHQSTAHSSSAASGGAGLSVKLSYPKSADHSLSLSAQSATSSIFDLKTAYASKYNVPVDKIKLLYAKRPVADSKTLADVLGADASTLSEQLGGGSGQEAEFSVMLLGGVVPSLQEPVKETKGVEEASRIPVGKELETEDFWDDLKGFLIQRLKDEKEGERLAKVFRKAAS